jgi:hypothetical protein
MTVRGVRSSCNRGDEIHLQLGKPLRARARKDQDRHADHQQEEHAKADRQIAAARIRDERTEGPTPAMPYDQAPVLIRTHVMQERKPRDCNRRRRPIFLRRRMKNMNWRSLSRAAQASENIHRPVGVGDFRVAKARVR